jgi:hypothetical protein
VLVGTPWDARTYDQSSQPQQAWASDVLARLDGIASGTILAVTWPPLAPARRGRAGRGKQGAPHTVANHVDA